MDSAIRHNRIKSETGLSRKERRAQRKAEKAAFRASAEYAAIKEARSNRRTMAFLALIMVVGLCLLAYPTVSDYWNSIHATRSIATYLEQTASLSELAHDDMLEEALAYNRDLARHVQSADPSEERSGRYNKALSFEGSTIMGYIEIPIIGVQLPIYHGTSESVLEVAVGHLDWSSLPVGAATYDYDLGMVTDPEDGAHCVISGHRGLPSARLFTDLDQLVEGDTFTLCSLGDVYTYEVDQIRTVLPEDVSELKIIPGKDLCTLVTCTPYGINSHRLLIRGHRIDNPLGKITVTSDAVQIRPALIATFIAVPVLLILFVYALVAPPKNKDDFYDD